MRVSPDEQVVLLFGKANRSCMACRATDWRGGDAGCDAGCVARLHGGVITAFAKTTDMLHFCGIMI
jgi:hypothetical protein